jgi:hypothetical protein
MVDKRIFKMRLFFWILVLSLAGSCSRSNLFEDDNLSIERAPFAGNQLKIEGYFYHQYGVQQTASIYFLFSNGTILLAGDNYEINRRNEFEQTFITRNFIEKLKGIKFCWGVYKIEGNLLAFERWYPSERPYKAYVRAGSILNDTTFIITESYRMKNGNKTQVRVENETYHFRQFKPKPDSTNAFIP